jgi:hypothetical protein
VSPLPANATTYANNQDIVGEAKGRALSLEPNVRFPGNAILSEKLQVLAQRIPASYVCLNIHSFVM